MDKKILHIADFSIFIRTTLALSPVDPPKIKVLLFGRGGRLETPTRAKGKIKKSSCTRKLDTRSERLDIGQRPLSDMLTACPRRFIFEGILSARCLFLSHSAYLFFTFFLSLSPFPFSSRPFASRRCWTDNRFDDKLEQGNFRSSSHSRPAVSDATIILSIPSIRARRRGRFSLRII